MKPTMHTGTKAPQPTPCNKSPVLPGEDAAAFRRMRRELYDLHRPRTGNEARCVEAIAECDWARERCREAHRDYHAKLRSLRQGTGEPHCERDPHRWQHSAMDCVLEAKRLGMLRDQERRNLEKMQKQRRENQLADAKARAEERPVLAPEEDVQEVLPETDQAPVGRASVPGHAEPMAPMSADAAPDEAPSSNDAEAAASNRKPGAANHPPAQADFTADTAEDSAKKPCAPSFPPHPAACYVEENRELNWAEPPH